MKKKKRQPKRLLSPHYEKVTSRLPNGKAVVLTPESDNWYYGVTYRKRTKKI